MAGAVVSHCGGEATEDEAAALAAGVALDDGEALHPRATQRTTADESLTFP
jgi:hypothetical protein